MNRLSLAPKSLATDLLENAEQYFSARTDCTETDGCFFAPIHYEPNYAYPLIVWLHGDEATQYQIQQLISDISLRNFVAVGPSGVQVGAEAWPVSDRFAAEQRVFSAIKHAQRKYHVNPARVFVCGCGSGGSMAIRIGLSHPDQFAGAISIGGGFPSGGSPLSNLAAARQLPLLFSYARDSECHPIEEVCDQLRLWHAAGLNVTLRQYPSGISPSRQMLHDLNVWIMEIVAGASTQPAPESSRSSFKLN